MSKFKKRFGTQDNRIVLAECHCAGYIREQNPGWPACDEVVKRVFKPDDPDLANCYRLEPCLGKKTTSRMIIWGIDPPYETKFLPVKHYTVYINIQPVEACVAPDVMQYLAYQFPIFPERSPSVRGSWTWKNITPPEQRGPAAPGYIYNGDDIEMTGQFDGHLMPHDTMDDYRDPTDVNSFRTCVSEVVAQAEGRAQVSLLLVHTYTMRQVFLDGTLQWTTEGGKS